MVSDVIRELVHANVANAPDILELLRHEVGKAGSVTAFAAEHGVTRELVTMTLSGKRDVSDMIANALGFMRPAYFIRSTPL
jgi:DNA-binding phage protein